MSMQTVTVPSQFFRAELRMYSDWREALWRELIQNSLDAGSTRIDIDLGADADDRLVVRFTDDGSGMDRTVLENVFFALGETTKGSDAIGGYGRARIITCFAQESYTIRTGRLLVRGQGGTYEIAEAPDRVTGCVFEIVTVLASGDESRLTSALESLVQASTFTVPVTLNGRRVWASRLPGRARRVLRDAHVEWGKAYVEPGYGAMQVTVGGLLMFCDWISADVNVTVELTPHMAREVMIASRDALREPYRSILAEFTDALSINKAKAFEQVEPIAVRLHSGGFISTGLTDVDDAAMAPTHDDEAGQGTFDSTHDQAAIAAFQDARPATTDDRNSMPATIDAYAGDRWDTPDAPVGCDVYLFTDDKRRHTNAVQAWNPYRWGTGGNRRKVLLAWKGAIEYCIERLLNGRPGVIDWTIGVTFDEGVRGNTRRVDGGFVYAINPLGTDGKIAYRTSDAASMRALLAVAAHEVAHTVCSDHDENFAVLLTDLFARIDQGDALAAMRTAMRD